MLTEQLSFDFKPEPPRPTLTERLKTRVKEIFGFLKTPKFLAEPVQLDLFPELFEVEVLAAKSSDSRLSSSSRSLFRQMLGDPFFRGKDVAAPKRFISARISMEKYPMTFMKSRWQIIILLED